LLPHTCHVGTLYSGLSLGRVSSPSATFYRYVQDLGLCGFGITNFKEADWMQRFFALSLGINWNNYYLLEGISDTTHGGTNKNHYRPHKHQLSMEGPYFKKYVFWGVFFLLSRLCF
jgi:hypothetical protein